MSPIAPAELSAFELNELSTLIVEYMMYSGTPYSVEYVLAVRLRIFRTVGAVAYHLIEKSYYDGQCEYYEDNGALKYRFLVFV